MNRPKQPKAIHTTEKFSIRANEKEPLFMISPYPIDLNGYFETVRVSEPVPIYSQVYKKLLTPGGIHELQARNELDYINRSPKIQKDSTYTENVSNYLNRLVGGVDEKNIIDISSFITRKTPEKQQIPSQPRFMFPVNEGYDFGTDTIIPGLEKYTFKTSKQQTPKKQTKSSKTPKKSPKSPKTQKTPKKLPKNKTPKDE